MIELIALLVALATPDDRLNYLAVGHMSGSAGLGNLGIAARGRRFALTPGYMPSPLAGLF